MRHKLTVTGCENSIDAIFVLTEFSSSRETKKTIQPPTNGQGAHAKLSDSARKAFTFGGFNDIIKADANDG